MRILHANANTLIRNGFKSILQKGGGVDSITFASSFKELENKLNETSCDLIVMDPHPENGFGSASITAIRQRYPDTKILVISDVSNQEKVLGILEVGAHGYLTYECDEDEIVHAVFALHKGEKFYCNKVLDIVLNKHLYKKESDNCEPTTLSQRETEIATLLATGLTNKEVAQKLIISPHTVHTHRKNIMKKIGVRSVSELTIYCVSIGLVEAQPLNNL